MPEGSITAQSGSKAALATYWVNDSLANEPAVPKEPHPNDSQVDPSRVTVAEAVQLQSEKQCIDVDNDRLTMAQCANLARQLWRIEPSPKDGYSWLKSLAGEDQCLDA